MFRSIRLACARRPIVAAVLCACAQAAGGADAVPPPQWPGEVIGPPTLLKRPTEGLLLAGNLVAFEKATLAEVRRTAGAGSVASAKGLSYLCFTDAASAVPFRLWIYAIGPAGPGQRVTGVMAERLAAGARASPACPALPARLKPVSLEPGGWIGMPVQQLLMYFGRPSGTRGEWAAFSYVGRASRDKPECEVGNAVEARLRKGAVEALRAGQVSSC